MIFKKKSKKDKRYANLYKKYQKGKITADEYMNRAYEALCVEAYNFLYETKLMQEKYNSYIECLNDYQKYPDEEFFKKCADFYEQCLPVDVEARNLHLFPAAAILDNIDYLYKERNNGESITDYKAIADRIYEMRNSEYVLSSKDLYINMGSEKQPLIELDIKGRRYGITGFIMAANSVRREIFEEKENTDRNSNGFYPVFEDDLIELMKQGTSKRKQENVKTKTLKIYKSGGYDIAD